jgi:hypothetical protein
MKSSIGSASLSFFRVAGVGRCVAFLLLSGLVFLPLTAGAGLPRAAISIPADRNLAAGLRSAEQCEFQGKLIVLPPLPFQFVGDENTSLRVDGISPTVVGTKWIGSRFTFRRSSLLGASFTVFRAVWTYLMLSPRGACTMVSA